MPMIPGPLPWAGMKQGLWPGSTAPLAYPDYEAGFGLDRPRFWPILILEQAFGLTDRTLGYLVNVTLAFDCLNKKQNRRGIAAPPVCD